MKKSVGLVVIVPIADSRTMTVKPAALLQVRGKWNGEKNAPESFSGCCQVTCHGKLEENEDFLPALMREAREELGQDFTDHFLTYGRTKLLTELRTPDKWVQTYWRCLGAMDYVRSIRLDIFSGGLMPLIDPTMIMEITTEMKVTGCPQGIIAMFPDERAAVAQALLTYQRMSMSEGGFAEMND